MKFLKIILPGVLLICQLAALAQMQYQWKKAASGGYAYRYVTNDPLKTRFYTLRNGLTVILSPNHNDPHVVYRMVVRAGSNNDPQDNTGLAHYLEHLLFKGTEHLGTLDYAKEKPLLDQIEKLYENYRHTTDETERKIIYHQIDSLSGAASGYSIANEYDQLMKSIGSSSTNAYTSTERTVYEEDFPSNTLDKFLAVQSERFHTPVFRNFHTELETVYEEKNRSLDDEQTASYQKMMAALFPTHHYGQQTTIGTIEHLKNPSLVAIKKYYEQYYVPNNMAMVMAGDFNADKTIRKIDRAFSCMVAKPFSPYEAPIEAALRDTQVIDVLGQGTENLSIAYRGPSQNIRESLLLDLISGLLVNGKAGLIDRHITQQQKMLRAGARYSQLKDYGVFLLTGTPKPGQTLEQARNLLLAQIRLIQQGDFDAGLIKATAANKKLLALEDIGNNEARANNLVECFVFNKGERWDKWLSETDVQSKVTKKEIVAFAKQFFTNNYVIVFKRKGVAPPSIKVAKPQITAIKTNAGAVSPFAKSIMDAPVKAIAPKFLDYQKDLFFAKAGIADVIAVKNTDNTLFSMTYRIDIGSNHIKSLPLAAKYLAFLGTDHYSPEMINQLFYDMACSYSIYVEPEQTLISISGLQENFDKAVALLEHVLLNCKANSGAMADLKTQALQSRSNAKLDPGKIMTGLQAYAQFGKDNPFNYVLTNQEINQLAPADLVKEIHELNQYQHTITYYGPLSPNLFAQEIGKLHRLPHHFRNAPLAKQFVYTSISAPQVYFANYDRIQTEIHWQRNIEPYNPADAAVINTFNNYFGDGMGAIVSQTIRESRALAYSTFAMVWPPDSRTKPISLIAYVGTQGDKMLEAVTAMDSLLTELPLSPNGFALSKANIINKLSNSRISRGAIIPAYLADRKLGYSTDSRITQYQAMQTLQLIDIQKFYDRDISGKAYNYCVVGSSVNVNPASLSKFGKVIQPSLTEIFGY